MLLCHMFIREDPTFYKLDHSELIEWIYCSIESKIPSKLLTRKSTDLHVSEWSHIHIDGWFEHNTKPVNQVKINNMLYKQNLSTSDKLIYNVTVRDTILHFLFRSHIIKGNEKSQLYSTALKKLVFVYNKSQVQCQQISLCERQE